MKLGEGNNNNDSTQVTWRKCDCCNISLPLGMFKVTPKGVRSNICSTCESNLSGTFDKSVTAAEVDREQKDYVPLDGLDMPLPQYETKPSEDTFDPAKAAAAILKRRELARRRLLPFIMEFKRGYSVGWVHKDITRRLEKFAAMVERGESPRLMLFMPPRSGKSEIVSRNFPAWFLGRNPEMEIIACSYAASLANSFSRKVREILRDPAFKHIFPECELDKENQAVEQWMTAEGGAYVSAGVGGSIVGKGAHCVDGNLTVRTSRGIMAVSKVRVGDYVYGYDHITGKPVYSRVEGVSLSRKDRLYDFSGIRVTPDHRVLDGSNYIQAAELNETSRLVSLLRLPENAPQGVEGGATFVGRNWRERADNVLLEVMRENLAESWRKSLMFMREPEGAWGGDMPDMLREVAVKRVEERRDEIGRLRTMLYDFLQTAFGDSESENFREGEQAFLFARMLQDFAEQHGAECACILQELLVTDIQETQKILLTRMLSNSKSRGAEFRAAVTVLSGRVSDSEGGCYGAGQGRVPAVRFDDTCGSTPYKPQREEQQHVELDNPLQEVSCVVSCTVGDSASSLKDNLHTKGGFEVVDLQTATGNFFVAPANASSDEEFTGYNILVHNCLIIDDPVKGRDEAQSENTKESVRDWYTGSAYTRLAPGGGVLIIMQRWAEDDLAGWLLEQDRLNEDEDTKENWEVVLYPAIAETDEEYRNKGEALHPERYNEKALARIRRTVGERDWHALFQQNPLPETGDYFKEEHFIQVPRSEYPDVATMNIFAAWDLALTEKESNDPSVGFYIGVCPDKLVWVLHVERCWLTSKDLTDRIFELDSIWRPSLTGFEEGHIEKAIGPFFEAEMIRRRHFIPFEPLKVGRRDKQMRATTWRGMMQAKQVYWDRNDETQLYAKAEYLKFPNGKHDDTVDAGAHIGMMCQHLVSKTIAKAPPKKGWREEFLKKMRVKGSDDGSFMSA